MAGIFPNPYMGPDALDPSIAQNRIGAPRSLPPTGGVAGQPTPYLDATPAAPVNTAAPASPTFQPGPGALPAQPGAQRVDPTFAGEPRSAFQMAMANLDQEHAAEQARYDQEEAQARSQLEAIRAQELEFENQELQARREDAIAARQARARARYEGRLSEDEVQADKERQERRQAAQGYAERENALEPHLPGGEIYSTEINYPRTTPRERPSNLGPTEREAAREMGYADVGEFLRGPRQGALGDFGPTGRGLVAPGSNLRHPRPGEHLEQDIASQQVTADIDRALGAAPGADEPIQDREAAAPTRAQLAAAEARRRTNRRNRRNRRNRNNTPKPPATDAAASEGSAAAGAGSGGAADADSTPPVPSPANVAAADEANAAAAQAYLGLIGADSGFPAPGSRRQRAIREARKRLSDEEILDLVSASGGAAFGRQTPGELHRNRRDLIESHTGLADQSPLSDVARYADESSQGLRRAREDALSGALRGRRESGN